MPFLYSTLTADQCYTSYETTKDGGPTRPAQDKDGRDLKVLVRGRMSARKILKADGSAHTGRAGVTDVSDEQLALLEKDFTFQHHVKEGHIVIEKSKAAKVVDVSKNMTSDDGSAQLKPKDFEEGGRVEQKYKTNPAKPK